MAKIIKSAADHSVQKLLGRDGGLSYVVPPYQREYAWGKEQCQKLLDDLGESVPGYFLGSILCVNSGESSMAPRLELVDGQQRMTTVSLLLAAAYAAIKKLPDDNWDEEERADIVGLRWNLVLPSPNQRIRVVPQTQGENERDYLAVMAEAKVVDFRKKPPNAGNRKIFRAFRQFQRHISEEVQGEKAGREALNAIMDFLKKVREASMVMIEVGDHAAAYTLFEALNDRGKPLMAIDIIKNKLMSRLSDVDSGGLDEYSRQWGQVLECLGGEEKSTRHQERFLRHYHNAFRSKLSDEQPEATRSNLIKIYEGLVAKAPKEFLRSFAEAARHYGLLLRTHEDDGMLSAKLRDRLESLDRIEGVPSYVLLLLLQMRRKELQLTDGQFAKVLDFLVRFFVRRNLTDKPATRYMDRIFMTIAGEILDKKQTGGDAAAAIHEGLRKHSASEDEFRRALKGPIYDDNSGVTRFVLCALCGKNKERSMWERDGRSYVWSIEHVFPQGEDIPDCWVEMMAGGDRGKAEKIQQSHVHKLGNLTLSGYNSNLGNKSFEEKQKAEKNGEPIGYKNGLRINSDLKNRKTWDAEAIDTRTQKMVDQAMRLFHLDD